MIEVKKAIVRCPDDYERATERIEERQQARDRGLGIHFIHVAPDTPTHAVDYDPRLARLSLRTAEGDQPTHRSDR